MPDLSGMFINSTYVSSPFEWDVVTHPEAGLPLKI